MLATYKLCRLGTGVASTAIDTYHVPSGQWGVAALKYPRRLASCVGIGNSIIVNGGRYSRANVVSVLTIVHRNLIATIPQAEIFIVNSTFPFLFASAEGPGIALTSSAATLSSLADGSDAAGFYQGCEG